jgi:prepilin-type N-terminal cleavage/methylation domain-containing protein
MTLNLRPTRRAAFTLVELMVVLAIILFLTALLVAFLPAVYSQNAESQGAVNLQGWLNIARQKAIRNQNPYGLRLWVNSQNLATLQVVECQYIEQPDDFTSQTATISALIPPYNTVNFTGIDLTGGMGGNASLYPVQPNDYLEVLGTGLMHQVIGVSSPTTLIIATPLPFPLNAATNFRIMRQARVIGSETLPLPDGVVVDLQTNTTYNNPLPTFQYVPPQPNATGAYVDVLFSPAGSLLGVSQGYLAFWVRQPDLSAVGSPTNVFSGSPTIIAVFAQTGLVGAYPPVPGATPYSDIH